MHKMPQQDHQFHQVASILLSIAAGFVAFSGVGAGTALLGIGAAVAPLHWNASKSGIIVT